MRDQTLIPKRKSQGLNIAFIDIMSCGLGAILLVFILVKPEVSSTESTENKRLSEEIEQAYQKDKTLDDSIDEITHIIADTTIANQLLTEKIAGLRNTLIENKNFLAQQKALMEQARKSVIKQPVKQTGDIFSDQNQGEEEYLLGLKVEGKRIVFLVDSSASMTDEHLIDIIRRKSGTGKNRKAGPKWQRTRRIVRWLLSRLPESSQVSVIRYSDKAEFLGGARWHHATNQSGIRKILQDLDDIVPFGPTDLHTGLLKVRSLTPDATDLYVITDGLPTVGQSGYAGLNPFSDCHSLLGRSSTISGECRVKLFHKTILDAATGPGVRVNVVLLPLEGDPEASSHYWLWAGRTGGLLISPAEDWP